MLLQSSVEMFNVSGLHAFEAQIETSSSASAAVPRRQGSRPPGGIRTFPSFIRILQIGKFSCCASFRRVATRQRLSRACTWRYCATFKDVRMSEICYERSISEPFRGRAAVKILHFPPQRNKPGIFPALSNSPVSLWPLSRFQSRRAAGLIGKPPGVAEEGAGVLFLSVSVGVPNPPRDGRWTQTDPMMRMRCA